MKMKTLKLSMLAFTAIITGLTSCSKDPVVETATTVTKTDSINVPFSATAPNTFFSFKNGAVVANSDSATTNWDFGLRFVNFIFNSHASGQGNAGVIVKQGLFDTTTVAPVNGYAYDTAATATSSIKPAIPFDVHNSWFLYDDITHAFSPKAGWYFIIRTADNHYVKMEILSVGYKDFVGPVPNTLIYKFRYTYQADGSTNLK